MLISQKSLQQTRSKHVKTRIFLTAADSQSSCKMLTVPKCILDSGVQMLLANEMVIVAEDNDAKITLQNHGGNDFSLEVTNFALPLHFMARITPSGICCSDNQQIAPNDSKQNAPDDNKQSRHGTQNMQFGSIALYVHKQMIPLYSECVLTSRDMQDCFGQITYAMRENRSMSQNKKMSDSFMLDNAVSIGMLTDMLNRKWHRNLKQALHADNDKPLSVYSVEYAARLLFLASVFCATAPPAKKSSLFHVSQTRMTEMPAGMQDLMWSEIKPERNGVSLLLKGDSTQQRIMRCNLSVRKVDAQHKFATECMPSVMGMNASGSTTDIVLVTGVMNKNAAAIYIDSDTVDVHAHRIATAAFMGRGSF